MWLWVAKSAWVALHTLLRWRLVPALHRRQWLGGDLATHQIAFDFVIYSLYLLVDTVTFVHFRHMPGIWLWMALSCLHVALSGVDSAANLFKTGPGPWLKQQSLHVSFAALLLVVMAVGFAEVARAKLM
jgi:hypothetical protein